MYVNVAVNVPAYGLFTYAVPAETVHRAAIGKRVLVPFGRRTITGYILETTDEPGVAESKSIIDVLDDEPLFSSADAIFYRWLSQYYLYPIGKTLTDILPAGITTDSDRFVTLGQDFDDAPFTPLQREIVSLLKEHPEGLSARVLARKLGRKQLTPTLRRLAERGCVAIHERIEKPTVAVRHESVITACGPLPADIKLTEKQAAVFHVIESAGTITVSELSRQIPHVHSVLRSLEKKELIIRGKQEQYRRAEAGPEPGSPKGAITLNEEQGAALCTIRDALRTHTFTSLVLHGVTGSGKTEIYLKAIEEALALGGSALVLVPEIGLTPFLTSRIGASFGTDRLAVLHSGVTRTVRYDEWRRIQRKEALITIGARSAVFAPASDLRLIIVDEEYDPSYKQDVRLRYHARDAAVMKAKLAKAVILLGAATPDVQTYFNTHHKNYRCLTLSHRYQDRPLPAVTVVDMKNEPSPSGGPPILSRALHTSLEETLAQGKQAMLFLNRRGFTTFLFCRRCGHVFRCRNCSVSLTYHMTDNMLRCHYCDYAVKSPPLCPHCSGTEIGSYGVGTEKLYDTVRELFPAANIARMDSDTTTQRGSHAALLSRLDRGEIDILIGTQMITKGHDFPNVTLVGVVSADMSLNVPDFRAAERTFQLLTQVSGRGGRGSSPGTVIIQTISPDDFSIRYARHHDYAGFYGEEIEHRRALTYPPFSRMIALHITGRDTATAARSATATGRRAREIIKNKNVAIDVLGPAESPLSKIRGAYRWQVILKSADVGALHEVTHELLASHPRGDGTLTVDVDPVNFM